MQHDTFTPSLPNSTNVTYATYEATPEARRNVSSMLVNAGVVCISAPPGPQRSHHDTAHRPRHALDMSPPMDAAPMEPKPDTPTTPPRPSSAPTARICSGSEVTSIVLLWLGRPWPPHALLRQQHLVAL